MSKLTAAEKLRAALKTARLRPGEEEGQIEWVLGRLSSALAVYAWKTGADADIGPPPRLNGKHLAGVIKAATALREHLRALPADVQIALGMSPVEIQIEADGAQVVNPIDPCRELIERAQRIQTRRSGGRPANEPLEALLLEITVQWRCAFDPDPENNPFLGIVHHGNASSDAQRYSGELLDFAVAVLKSHGINGGARAALGRRLYALITKKWRMSRHENRPPKPH